MTSHTIAILGAGSWGTAVGIHLARHGHRVLLWGHDPNHITQLQQHRCNTRFLPDFPFPEGLEPVSDLTLCQAPDIFVIIAIPSHGFTALLDKLTPPKQGIAWLTKGLNPEDQALLSQIVANRWGADYPVAAISGPSFAKEVAQNLPTALTLASNNQPYQKVLQKLLHKGHLRVYFNADLIGVQICGAVKNVLAIACGIADALELGANTRAALITRGLAEMRRLGMALGAQEETFAGLAGLGDLVLTCTDNQSRNRRFGLLLGQGHNATDAEAAIGQVVEGRQNAKQVYELAQKYQVEMPITFNVHSILEEKISPKQAVVNLLSRAVKME